MTINSPVAITTNTLADWTQNQSGYSQTIATTGGTAPLTFSVAVGNLPAGLTINSSTGVIAGTPTAVGSTTFTIELLIVKVVTAGSFIGVTGYRNNDRIGCGYPVKFP